MGQTVGQLAVMGSMNGFTQFFGIFVLRQYFFQHFFIQGNGNAHVIALTFRFPALGNVAIELNKSGRTRVRLKRSISRLNMFLKIDGGEEDRHEKNANHKDWSLHHP
ncbi:MAG: hypothetical protein A2X86_06780 [Bdellovibrionales bacterium GWA2_49_15]|nr:MAG: hypothetical protein A2X86_06780 [Bdellovibrionales bacterium GWA2_49_15]